MHEFGTAIIRDTVQKYCSSFYELLFMQSLVDFYGFLTHLPL